MVDKLYLHTLEQFSDRINPYNIDFIGLNINVAGQIECKIYPTPEPIIDERDQLSAIEGYVLQNNLLKCKCCAYSLSGERSYLALKNKSKNNIQALFEELENRYPYISKNLDEIKKISLLKVSDSPELCYSSLHMIGDKTLCGEKHIINVEWITRAMSDVNNPSENYEYKDQLYLDYLESLNIESLSYLCSLTHKYFFENIQNEELHLWLVACDYYPMGEKKYKLYFKGKPTILHDMKGLFSNIAPDRTKAIDQVYNFLLSNENLSLYGFAIGINANNVLSFNYYLIENN